MYGEIPDSGEGERSAKQHARTVRGTEGAQMMGKPAQREASGEERDPTAKRRDNRQTGRPEAPTGAAALKTERILRV
ncbi:hypothetical protein PanWU01x14_118680 [Parasponia andersonii]|uniref:Uncharacterized protein n=1 Tax=Parasponia andersonii TaxID=3476 RepID=A0A2P5CVS4_PARAD|nr:hypothetical protein PanWU01x14_118680 [Parasponia andersonii]